MSESRSLRNRPLTVEFQILGIPDSGRTSETLAVTSEIIAWNNHFPEDKSKWCCPVMKRGPCLSPGVTWITYQLLINFFFFSSSDHLRVHKVYCHVWMPSDWINLYVLFIFPNWLKSEHYGWNKNPSLIQQELMVPGVVPLTSFNLTEVSFSSFSVGLWCL